MKNDGDFDAKVGPVGERAIAIVAMPADTNPRGDIFGGWLMSQMDLAGGIMAVVSTWI